MPLAIAIFQIDGLMVSLNTAAEQLWQFRRADFVGSYNTLTSPASLATGIDEVFARVLRGETFHTEPTLYDTANMQHEHPEPKQFWIERTVFPLHDASDAIAYVGIVYRDVTPDVLKQRTLEQQQDTIRALASPFIQVWDGVLLVPLVGHLDAARMTSVTEQLLDNLVRVQADIVIVDLTGVPLLDLDVAHQILLAVKAVRLIGAEIVLTGIGEAQAQTLVALNIDMTSLATQATLQDSLEWAFQRQGLRVVSQHPEI